MMSFDVLADISTPMDLSAALRRRAEQLAVTREVLDEVSGLPSGYSAKLLSAVPSRALGATSLPLMLGALGVKLLLVEDHSPAAEALMQRMPKRNRCWVRSSNHWRERKKAATAAAVELNRRRRAALTPERRRAIATKASRAAAALRSRRRPRSSE